MSVHPTLHLWIALLTLGLAMAPSRGHGASEERQTAHLRSRVVAAEMAAQPGQTVTLGLLFEHDEHWHTYWRNPGDSGLKTEVEMRLPDGVQFLGIDWPAPQRFELGELVNFGYDGRTLLPLRLAIPADYNADTLPIAINARWLICESECIPGKADYALTLPVQRGGTVAVDPRWRADFARSARRQPQPAVMAATLRANGDGLLLTLTGADLPEELSDWILFPVAEELIAYGPRPRWQRRDAAWQAILIRSDYFTALPTNSDWLLVNGDRALAFRASADSQTASPHHRSTTGNANNMITSAPRAHHAVIHVAKEVQ